MKADIGGERTTEREIGEAAEEDEKYDLIFASLALRHIVQPAPHYAKTMKATHGTSAAASSTAEVAEGGDVPTISSTAAEVNVQDRYQALFETFRRYVH